MRRYLKRNEEFEINTLYHCGPPKASPIKKRKHSFTYLFNIELSAMSATNESERIPCQASTFR